MDVKKSSKIPARPAPLRGFARARRGGPLAEYVILLVSIMMVSIGAIILLGTRITTIFTTTQVVVDSSQPENPGEPGSPDDEYDPGGGFVTSLDVEKGCPLVPGAEYFRDNKTTELPGWALIVLDPESYGPGDPLPGISFMGPGLGGWWFRASEMKSSGATVYLPSDSVFDLYLDEVGEFFLGGLYTYSFTDRVEFSKHEMKDYDNCSDRSGDGGAPPPDVSANTGTAGTASAGTGGSAGPAVQGFFDVSGDEDWYRLDVPETESAVQVNIVPTLIKGREAQNPSVRILDSSGSGVDNLASTSNRTTALAAGILSGAYYIAAMNDTSSYAGMGGYEITATFVEDTPYHRSGASPMTIGVDVEEDILEGDEGDTFTFTTTEESTIQFVLEGINDGLEQATLTLFDGAGEEIASDEGEVAAILENALPADTYFVRVQSRYGSTRLGDYRLSSAYVVDTPYPHAQAEPMTIGVDVEEDIFEGDEGDTFTFTTTEESTIQVIVSGLTGGLEAIKLTLYDSAGNQVEKEELYGEAAVVGSDLPADTYFVRVQTRYPSTRLGDYRLSSAYVVDTPNSRSGSKSIAIGEATEEDILNGDEGDMFHVSISEQKDLLFHAKGVGANAISGIEMTVFDGSGSELKDWDRSDEVRILLNHLEAGDYYVRVAKRYSSTEPGDYSLTVTAPDDVSPTFDHAQEAIFDTPLSEDFVADIDYDMFRFSNPSEQQVLIKLTAPHSVKFWVYDASGTQMKKSSSGNTSQALLNTLPAGDYYVKADAEYGDLMGYTLLVEAIDDTLGDFSGARVIGIGELHSEDIATRSDVDMYRFTNPGVQDVDVTVSGATTYIRVKVYDSSLTRLESQYGSNGTTVSMTALPAGDYYVSVETEYSYTSDYDLEVSIAGGP